MASLPMAGALEEGDFHGPFQPKGRVAVFFILAMHKTKVQFDDRTAAENKSK